ncbi:hypothetical protein [Synechococcus sp. CC9605]|nr:hypothetical protein [Synechococcus sp. CC9605]
MTFFNAFTLPSRETGILVGIACGLFNIDKDTVIPGSRRAMKN